MFKDCFVDVKELKDNLCLKIVNLCLKIVLWM